MAEKVQKADRKKLQESNRLLKAKLKEENRVAREEAKAEREREKAETVAKKAAEREAQKQARNAAKAIQLSQTGKRKASRPPTQKNKRQKRTVDAVGGCAAEEAPMAAPDVTTRSGRNVTLPSKYK